jgi:hypothetical protein
VLLGLWPIQFRALGRYLKDTMLAPEQLHAALTADVERAARLIETGLSTFAQLDCAASFYLGDPPEA